MNYLPFSDNLIKLFSFEILPSDKICNCQSNNEIPTRTSYLKMKNGFWYTHLICYQVAID